MDNKQLTLANKTVANHIKLILATPDGTFEDLD